MAGALMGLETTALFLDLTAVLGPPPVAAVGGYGLLVGFEGRALARPDEADDITAWLAGALDAAPPIQEWSTDA